MMNDLFAPWRDAWTLHLDDDLVVVDKPVGVSTHAPDPVRRDDAVSRLKTWLSARDGVAESAVYLGVHQRLDRDTSGVLLFARRKEANKSIAAAFEGRAAKKRYLAVVSPAPRTDGGTLDDLLVPADDGKMQVVTANPRHPPPKGAQRAVTRWTLVSRHGNRALVSLEPETGRTHQLRVQLAAMGTPIEGDPLYGKPSAAPRLMLHALSLTLPHPTTGRPVTFTAEAPKELLAWAKGEADPRSLDERLLAAADQRWDLARDPDTTAFRLAHDGDGFASTPIDVYGEWALVHCYDAALDEALTGALLVGGMRGVYVKHRPKQGNTVVDTRKESLAPKHAVSGEDAPEPMTVREHGLRYEVHLGDGLSTGIFLDQRENRRRVRELAKGQRVLNLFAYTGAFTVAAAAGGASQTVTVDVSATVIAWAQRNLELNELSGAKHSFVTSDVFPWMEAAKARKQVFDLVLLDPPSYATTRDSRFSAASDYPKLAALAMSLVAPGGRLLACTNHHEIARMKFRRWLYESARAVGREVTQAKDLPTPIDFPPPADGHAHLKSVLVTLK